MKLKLLFAFTLLINYSNFAQSTTDNGVKKNKSSNFIFKAAVAYGIRLGSNPPGLTRQQEEYASKLKKGISYDLGVYYRVDESAALGFKYNTFNSKGSLSNQNLISPSGDTGFGTTSDDITISFYGLSYLMDNKYNNSKHEINLELAAGYIDLRNKTFVLGKYEIYGGSIGIMGGFSYKYRFLKDLSVGPSINFVGGTLRNFTIEGDNGFSRNITLNKDSYESLWRIDLGIEAIYRL